MNIYEANEPVCVVQALYKKMRMFFLLYRVFWLFLGSFMFIRFIKLDMRIENAKDVRQLAHGYLYFMNLMNTYEGRVFMRFFENIVDFTSEFMNLKSCLLHTSSLKIGR